MRGAATRTFKDLTLAQLRSFAVVCRLGSYAAAARELLLTSPAVWEQMQGLERHYGCRLLVRRGNGIAATPEGQQLLDMIRPVLAAIDSTRDVVQQRGGAAPAVLTVATNLRVLADEISQALRRFQKQHRSVQLRLIFTGNDVDEWIADGRADVGLTLEPGPDQPSSATVTYEACGEVDYLLVAPRQHPLMRTRSFKLRQIADHPLVLGIAASYSRRRVEEVLHRHDLAGNIQLAVETSSDEYTLTCVRAGLGIGITIGIGQGQLYRGLAVRTLRNWFGTARVGFLWKQGAHLLAPQVALATSISRSISQR
jgi:LysR family cys regulon transcriptional activator